MRMDLKEILINPHWLFVIIAVDFLLIARGFEHMLLEFIHSVEIILTLFEFLMFMVSLWR